MSRPKSKPASSAIRVRIETQELVRKSFEKSTLKSITDFTDLLIRKGIEQLKKESENQK